MFLSLCVCVQIHPNPVGIALFSAFLATYLFYFYVRIRYTLWGGYFGYSLFILLVEIAASTNMVRPISQHAWLHLRYLLP